VTFLSYSLSSLGLVCPSSLLCGGQSENAGEHVLVAIQILPYHYVSASYYVLIAYFGCPRSLPCIIFLTFFNLPGLGRTVVKYQVYLHQAGTLPEVLCFSVSIIVVAAWAAVAYSQGYTSSVVLEQVQEQIQTVEVVEPSPSSEFQQAVAGEACHP
jgi:hypothetical protein